MGPRTLDEYYPDDGRIWESDFKLPTRIDVFLESIDTKKTTIKECIVYSGAKAHTYNKYPDNHPKDKWVSATASFEVESGIYQTGIAYPKSDNAKNETPFSSKNVDGSSIEFVGRDGIGFDPGDYRLLKIIVLDE